MFIQTAKEQYNYQATLCNIWPIINKTIDQDRTLELILTDTYPIYYHKDPNDLYSHMTIFTAKNRAIESQRAITHILAAARLGAEETFNFFLDQLSRQTKYQFNIPKTMIAITKAAMLSGHAGIMKTIENTIHDEALKIQISDEYIKEAIKYDKSDAATLAQNLKFSKTPPSHNEPTDILNKAHTFIQHQSWANPQEMEKIHYESIPRLSFSQLLQKVFYQYNFVQEPHFLKSNTIKTFLATPHPALQKIFHLMYSHFNHINENIDPEIIRSFNTLTAQLKESEAIGYDIVHEELKGILLRHLFFAKPLHKARSFVDRLLQNITILQNESLTQKFPHDQNIAKIRYAHLSHPYERFILDNIPQHITCIKMFQSIDTFIDFVFLAHVTTYRQPFFTVTMFKNALLKLEDEYTVNQTIITVCKLLKKFPTYMHYGDKIVDYENVQKQLNVFLETCNHTLLSPIECAALAGDQTLFNMHAKKAYSHTPLSIAHLAPYIIAGGNETIISSYIEKIPPVDKDIKTYTHHDKKIVENILKASINYHNIPIARHILTSYSAIIDPTKIPYSIVSQPSSWNICLEKNMLDLSFLDDMVFHARINGLHSVLIEHPQPITQNSSNIPMEQKILLLTALYDNKQDSLNTLEKELTSQQLIQEFSESTLILDIIKSENIEALKILLRYNPSLLTHENPHPRQILQAAIKAQDPRMLATILEHNKNVAHQIFTINDCILSSEESKSIKYINNLFKRLFKNKHYEKLTLIFDHILLNHYEIKSDEMSIFLYHCTRDYHFFMTIVDTLQKYKRFKLSTLQFNIPHKLKAILPSKAFLNVIDIACLHNNTQLVEYASKQGIVISFAKILYKACVNNNLPLIKIILHEKISTLACNEKEQGKATYQIFLYDLLECFFQPPFENPVISMLLDVESEYLQNKQKQKPFVHEMIKMINSTIDKYDKTTSLMLRTKLGLIMASFFEKNPTSVTITDHNDENALHIAAQYDHCADFITPCLLKYGCPLITPHHPCKSPLQKAIWAKNTLFIKTVLPYLDPSYLNEKDTAADGNTLLFEAIKYDRYDIAQLFITHGAHAFIQNNTNTSPYTLLHIKKNEYNAQAIRHHTTPTPLSFANELEAFLILQNVPPIKKHIDDIDAILAPLEQHIHQHNVGAPHEPASFIQAIRDGNKKLIMQLLNEGFSILEKQEQDDLPVFDLFGPNWDSDIVDLIIKSYTLSIILQLQDKKGNTILDTIVARNDLTLLKKITEHPDYQNSIQRALLHKTLYKTNNLEMIQELIKNIEQIETIPDNYTTLLHHSIKNNNTVLSTYLIQNYKKLSIKINDFNRYNITPLMLAIEKDQDDIVQLLCTIPNIKPLYKKCTKSGASMLHIATQNSMKKTVAFCLAKKCKLFDVNYAVTTTRDTALHIAAQYGEYEIASILLKHGANAEIVNRKGRTPLQNACIYHHHKIAGLILANAKKHSFSNNSLA